MFQTWKIHSVIVLGLPFGSIRKSGHNVCCNFHGQLQNILNELCYPFSTSQLIKDYTPKKNLYHIFLPTFSEQI
jgi:hypothetical protein